MNGALLKHYLSVPNTVAWESDTRTAILSLFTAVIFEYGYSFKNAICFSKYCIDTYFLNRFAKNMFSPDLCTLVGTSKCKF